MTETKTEQKALRRTVFGEVLCDLFESRDLLVTGPAIIEYADACGCDGEAVVRRTTSTSHGCGPLDGLARDLDLSVEERMDLCMAAAYDVRRDQKPA